MQAAITSWSLYVHLCCTLQICIKLSALHDVCMQNGPRRARKTICLVIITGFTTNIIRMELLINEYVPAFRNWHDNFFSTHWIHLMKVIRVCACSREHGIHKSQFIIASLTDQIISNRGMTTLLIASDIIRFGQFDDGKQQRRRWQHNGPAQGDSRMHVHCHKRYLMTVKKVKI